MRLGHVDQNQNLSLTPNALLETRSVIRAWPRQRLKAIAIDAA